MHRGVRFEQKSEKLKVLAKLRVRILKFFKDTSLEFLIWTRSIILKTVSRDFSHDDHVVLLHVNTRATCVSVSRR